MGQKREKTFERILDAAMRSFSLYGDRKTTFQTIADLSGMSQPLVAKYFGTREAVFPYVVDKWLGDALASTTHVLAKAKTPQEKLKIYIRSQIRMFRVKPETFKTYLLLHYHAGFDERFLKKNTEIKTVAVERVAEFIREGIAKGCFKKCDPMLTAKIIHCSLVGVVLGITTEKPKFTDLQLQKTLEDMVFSFLVK